MRWIATMLSLILSFMLVAPRISAQGPSRATAVCERGRDAFTTPCARADGSRTWPMPHRSFWRTARWVAPLALSTAALVVALTRDRTENVNVTDVTPPHGDDGHHGGHDHDGGP